MPDRWFVFYAVAALAMFGGCGSRLAVAPDRNGEPLGQTINYDPGGVFTNLFVKYPGWRAREGYGQPALGLVGVDPCPPACVGK